MIVVTSLETSKTSKPISNSCGHEAQFLFTLRVSKEKMKSFLNVDKTLTISKKCSYICFIESLQFNSGACAIRLLMHIK